MKKNKNDIDNDAELKENEMKKKQKINEEKSKIDKNK